VTANPPKIVGIKSEGKEFEEYLINRHVLPTPPSPTITHLMLCILNSEFVAAK
jgi:hypothetical protein